MSVLAHISIAGGNDEHRCPNRRVFKHTRCVRRILKHRRVIVRIRHVNVNRCRIEPEMIYSINFQALRYYFEKLHLWTVKKKYGQDTHWQSISVDSSFGVYNISIESKYLQKVSILGNFSIASRYINFKFNKYCYKNLQHEGENLPRTWVCRLDGYDVSLFQLIVEGLSYGDEPSTILCSDSKATPCITS